MQLVFNKKYKEFYKSKKEEQKFNKNFPYLLKYTS